MKHIDASSRTFHINVTQVDQVSHRGIREGEREGGGRGGNGGGKGTENWFTRVKFGLSCKIMGQSKAYPSSVKAPIKQDRSASLMFGL